MPNIDYLLKDSIIPDNQNFCCMSLWMNEDKKTIKAIRVSGAFKTLEEAQEQIQLLKEPGHYNFCAEVGAWNAFDPKPNKGDLNDQLNDMMKRYLLDIQKKNIEYEERKHSMIAKNILDNKKIKEEELEKETKEYQDITDEKEKKRKGDYLETLKKVIKELTTKYEENEKKKLENEDKLKNLKIEECYEVKEEENVPNQNQPVEYKGQVNRKSEKIEGQNWYCISFLAEENKSLVGIKISGCFNNEESANEHSRALRDINNSFSILVGELYKWQPFNPPPDSKEAGEAEYADEQLNETMKKKAENEKKAKLYDEFRKNELIKKNLEDSLNYKITEKESFSNKLKNSSIEEKESIEKELAKLDLQLQKLENKKKEITDKEAELSEKIGINELQKKLEMKNFNEKLKTLDV